MWRCWFFHTWGKWEPRKVQWVNEYGKDVGVSDCQKRICNRCGLKVIRETM